MATKTAILAVKIVSDAKDFTKGMDEAASKFDKFQNAAKKMAVPATAVLAGLGGIALGMGDMASKAEQNFGAVDAVFKEHAQKVKDMAAKSADALGLSASDYAKYSALIGSQLKNAGIPMDQLAGQTDKLIGQAADFAAQFGGTVPEAVEALSSALKGEMDPIEKYGISLSETKIKAQMAADGTDKLTGSAYDAAKAQAIMKLVNDQGKDSLGAFGREADTAAGQQARATAKWEDAAAKLGGVLLPVMTFAAEVLADVAKWVQENTKLVEFLVIAIGLLAGAIVVLNIAMGIMNIIAALNPWVIIVVAVLALIGVIIWLATQTTFFQDVWNAVAKFCSDVWNGFVGFVTDVWNGFMGFLKDALRNIGTFFSDTFNNIKTVASTVVNAVRDFFVNGFNGAKDAVSNAINGIKDFINGIKTKASEIANGAKDAISGAFNGARDLATGAIGGITRAIDGISGAVQGAINWVSQLFNMGGMPGWLSDVLGMGGTGFASDAFAAPVAGEFGLGATGASNFRSMHSNGPTKLVIDVEVNDQEAKRKLEALTKDRSASVKINPDTRAADKWLQDSHKTNVEFAPRGGGQAIALP